MAQCTAKSKRTREQCQKWAIRGKMTCRMHGGNSTGPKTKAGKERSRLAALRHGNYTKEEKALYREAMFLIRQGNDLLWSFSD